MFYHLIYPLHSYLSGLNVFRYITFRSAVAILVSLFIFLLFGLPYINYLRRKKTAVLRKLTPHTHQKKSGIPSMGGVLIIIGVVVSVLLCGKLDNANVLLCLMALIGYGTIGLIDDLMKHFKNEGKGIGVRWKFLLQVLLATGLVSYLYCFKNVDYMDLRFMGEKGFITEIIFPFFNSVRLDLKILYIPFGVFVIVAFSNAVNLTDGLDGLAVGLALLVLLSAMGLSYLTGHAVIASYLKIPFIQDAGEVSVFVSALLGACLGFLWFNAHPAQVFMGDTGSLAIGSVIGVLSLSLKIELLIPIIGGVFVLEALSVVLQVIYYKLCGKRLFKMAPIHHHFELMGWSESKIIMRFWILGAILALVGLASLKIR